MIVKFEVIKNTGGEQSIKKNCCSFFDAKKEKETKIHFIKFHNSIPSSINIFRRLCFIEKNRKYRSGDIDSKFFSKKIKFEFCDDK